MTPEALRRYELVNYDPRHGYPGRWGRYYRCPICGDIMPSSPPTALACGCGNILIDQGNVRVKHSDQQPLLLKRRGVIKRLLRLLERRR